MNIAEKKRVASPVHLHSLDALRGVAALAVVVSHWQHFFGENANLKWHTDFRRPFYSAFAFFATEGWRAVGLFFCLSGFIFYWLYSEKIATRRTSFREFAVLRFSRLWPLHLATLLYVAAGQHFLLHHFGFQFVYHSNDLYHFLLQLLLVSNWSSDQPFTFNGPVWSVSVEVFLYLLFFAVCFINFRRQKHLALLATGGVLLSFSRHFGAMSLGVLSFFVGGLAYYLFVYLSSKSISRRAVLWLTALALASWVVIPLYLHNDTGYQFYRTHVYHPRLSFHGKDILGECLLQTAKCLCPVVLFPLTILTLALLESGSIVSFSSLSLLGDMSYSIYLLHFPLQLTFVAFTSGLSLPTTFYSRPSTVALYFVILMPLSLLSYRFFERPVQVFLRSLLLGRSARPNESRERRGSEVTLPHEVQVLKSGPRSSDG